MTKKRLPLTEDPAFRDLNWDLPLNKDWDNTLQDGLEDEEWNDEEE